MTRSNDTPHISPRSEGFFEELREANPEGAQLLDMNAAKANIAMAARGMRMTRNVTQSQLSELTGLTQALISRVESPTGSMPTIETLMRYVGGLGGHLGLMFNAEAAVSQDALAPRRTVTQSREVWEGRARVKNERMKGGIFGSTETRRQPGVTIKDMTATEPWEPVEIDYTQQAIAKLV